MPPAAAEEAGRLRVAHLSPDTPAVDVAVAPVAPGSGEPLTHPGPDLVAGLSYGTVSDVVELVPGAYAVSVRAAGSERTVPPVLSARVEVAAGAAGTVTLGGRFADLALHSLTDDLSAPPPGSARVRVLAAAAEIPALDVAVRGGPSLATGLPFGAGGEARTVPAGAATLTVGGGGVAAAEVPMSFVAGSVVTLIVLDRPEGGLTVRPVLDAAGPSVVPAGGVEAGTGPLPGAAPALPLALPLATALVAVLGAAGRRGRVVLAVTGLAVTVGFSTPGTSAHATTGPVVLAPAPQQQTAPVRVLIPSVGVDAPLTGAGLDASGALVPPADPATAGWYTGGPVPGGTGPAVLAGHVDWAGSPAAFAGIADLDPGEEVLVGRADGSTARFTVTRVVHRAKSDFPAAEVYAPTSGAELRLITCGGAFDRSRGSYEDNVIVFARAR
ncbi:class F sortase [Blastococcus mobilis]|nr:class F sortase [Blastococcus mobilis]